jgi:hypothetical protein
MEQLKVRKKETIIYNVIIFLALSFFFLYTQHAYRHHLSPFSLVYLKKELELFWYLAVVLVVSSFIIWKHHRFAIYFYQASIFLVSFKVIEGLFIEFNKIIVVAIFFYIVISYFLYQLLSFYFNFASINPNYSKSDLFGPLLKTIPCKLKGDGVEILGSLSNWDDESCFVKLETAKELPGSVQIIVSFRDREFVQTGEVVASTLDLTGVGLKFEKVPKEINVFNWSEFMEIVHELGFQPQRLR